MIERAISTYLDGLAEGKLKGTKCEDCGAVFLPPRIVCRECGSTNLSWTEVNPEGKIKSFTIIHVAPVEFKDLAPYAVCLVDLDDGPTITSIYKGDLEKLEIGTPVELYFDTTLPRGSQLRIKLKS